jgi:hypothetical protein
LRSSAGQVRGQDLQIGEECFAKKPGGIAIHLAQGKRADAEQKAVGKQKSHDIADLGSRKALEEDAVELQAQQDKAAQRKCHANKKKQATTEERPVHTLPR